MGLLSRPCRKETRRANLSLLKWLVFTRRSLAGFARRLTLAILLIAIFPAASTAEEAPSGIDPSLVIEQFDVFNDGDMLLVPVKAFGRTRMFGLDTGCSLMIYDVSLRRFLGSPIKNMSASTPSGPLSVQLYDSPRSSLGSISLHTGSPVICHDLGEFNQMSLTPIEGVIGMATLQECVVQLDFDSGKLLFLRAVPKDAGTRIQLSQWRGIPTLQVEVEGHGIEEFAIDTGGVAEEAGRLNADLAVELEAKGLVTVSKTYTSVGVDASGDSHSRSLNLRGLRLGSYRMADVKISDKKGEGPSVLGMGYWSRFNVTFDFPNHQLYLQKCRHFDRPFKASLGGIYFVRRNNEAVVIDVRKNGPAAKSGIERRDVLLQIGGHEAKSTRVYKLYQEFGTPGTTVHVKLKRGDEIIDVDVVLPKEERVTRFEVDAAAKAARTAEATEGPRR